jgi:hypothetical protein
VVKPHVVSVCFKCFGCSRGMLHLFQMNVAKVYQNVAYVAMVARVCYKGLFQRFICVFERIVASVFIGMLHTFHSHMLQMFYLDIAYVCNGFQLFSCVFASVSETCFKYFICLQTYVASIASGCYKVDWVLHLLQYV